MSIFDLFRRPDINAGVQEWRGTKGAVLLDVRTPGESRQGHIEGSRNIPLQNISKVKSSIPDLNRPIFVHCLSGSRSAQAASALKAMGYSQVTNIGGISSYTGRIVK